MDKWLDIQQLWCPNCGHIWVLSSEQEITQEQHNVWIKAAMEHHKLIQEEKEE